MAKRPLVSIITATFNSEKTIRKAIESVLVQDYSRIEYIVADGESNDRTLEIAESYRDKFNQRGFGFRILSSSDTGIYAGMNKGISVANGELIGIVNSDDYYSPSIVRTAVKAYLKTGFDLFYAGINIVDGNGCFIRCKKPKRMRHYFTTRNWNHPTTFVPKRIYNIRAYDESFQYYGDWDFVLWVFKHFNNIVVYNRLLSNYRIGGKTTKQGFQKLKEKCRERYRGYRNNGCSRLYFMECILMDYGKEIVMRMMTPGLNK